MLTSPSPRFDLIYSNRNDLATVCNLLNRAAGDHHYPSVEKWLSDYSLDLQAPSGKTDEPLAPSVLLVGPIADYVSKGEVYQIKEEHPGLPIVMATQSPTLAETVSAVRQGAFDVVALPCQPDAIEDLLRRAAERGEALGPARRRIVDLRRRFATLTQAEHDVLEAMLSGKANKVIAQTLSIGLRTVELRRSKIMRKMGAGNLAELVKLVCEVKNGPCIASP